MDSGMPSLEVFGHCSPQAPLSTFLPRHLSAPALPLSPVEGRPSSRFCPCCSAPHPCRHCLSVRVMSPTLTASISTSTLVTPAFRCLLSTDPYIQSHPNTSPNALQHGLSPKLARLFSCLPCSFFQIRGLTNFRLEAKCSPLPKWLAIVLFYCFFKKKKKSIG